MRRIVVTGGAGLVGSNIARACLDWDPLCSVDVVDLDPTSALPYVTESIDPTRVRFTTVDLTEPGALDAIDTGPALEPVTHVVHAAALCHVPEWEVRDAGRFMEVNVMGTLRVLEWLRTLPTLERTIHVSSGGVYGEPTPWTPAGPQREIGPFNPPETYAISKLAGEQLARRYGELHSLDLRVVRLSGVFGPMERRTPGRLLMSMPYAIARAISAGEPLTISERTGRAGGDFLSAVDIGSAMVRLLTSPRLQHPAYNIAFGTFTPATALLDAATANAPGFSFEVAEDPTIDMNPDDHMARWNAYDITRLREDTGWTPRPLDVQLAEYLRWVALDPAVRAP